LFRLILLGWLFRLILLSWLTGLVLSSSLAGSDQGLEVIEDSTSTSLRQNSSINRLNHCHKPQLQLRVGCNCKRCEVEEETSDA
jgi:hypothetical protein